MNSNTTIYALICYQLPGSLHHQRLLCADHAAPDGFQSICSTLLSVFTDIVTPALVSSRSRCEYSNVMHKTWLQKCSIKYKPHRHFVSSITSAKVKHRSRLQKLQSPQPQLALQLLLLSTLRQQSNVASVMNFDITTTVLLLCVRNWRQRLQPALQKLSALQQKPRQKLLPSLSRLLLSRLSMTSSARSSCRQVFLLLLLHLVFTQDALCPPLLGKRRSGRSLAY